MKKLAVVLLLTVVFVSGCGRNTTDEAYAGQDDAMNITIEDEDTGGYQGYETPITGTAEASETGQTNENIYEDPAELYTQFDLDALWIIGETDPTPFGDGETRHPMYSFHARGVADFGLVDDDIFTFPDGQINPERGAALFLLNGSFWASARAHPYISYLIPLTPLVLAFGGEATWDEARLNPEFTLNGIHIGTHTFRPWWNEEEITRLIINGEDLFHPLVYFANDDLYVTPGFVFEHLGLEVGFHPGPAFPGSIIPHPLIWVDYPGSTRNAGKAQTQIKEQLIAALLEMLDEEVERWEAHPDITSTEVASLLFVVPLITKDIQSIRFIQMIGRYAVFSGFGVSPSLLVDMNTETIYFSWIVHNGGGLMEIPGDFDDPASLGRISIFTMGTLFG